MLLRRAEDRRYHLVRGESSPFPRAATVATADARPLHWLAYEWTAGREPEERSVTDPELEGEGKVLLLDLGENEAVMIAGAGIRRLPRGEGGEELLQRASVGAAAWEKEMARTVRWLRLPDEFLAYSERLNRAETVADVCQALTDALPKIVGAYKATVLLRDPKSKTLQSLETTLSVQNTYSLSIRSHPRLWRQGLVSAAEAQNDTGGPYAALSKFFTDTGAAKIAVAPLADEGIVFLVERRSHRNFEPEDWSLYRNVVQQAEAAMCRVRSMEELRGLSLTDPLTGAANRRRLDVVMEGAWASARRGRALSVALIDIDHFKKINDERGHIAGDRILQSVARVLRDEARGSDLVVRYGGDEFLILLPGETAAGAHVLVSRVQRRLAGQVEISAGIAQYSDDLVTPEEMLGAADENLYAVKRQIRWSKG